MNDPARLRQDILTARNRLSPQEIGAKSEAIRTTLSSLAELRDSDSVFIYANFRSEVATTGIIADLLAAGRQVSVPLTRVREKRLDIITLTDPVRDLVPGYCGIPEPRAELVASRRLDPHRLDLIILPGSVFDERCGRFGYGGGYYDRLLAAIPRARRIGLSFELQVVERLPLREHDELLDTIVTEERLIRGGRS